MIVGIIVIPASHVVARVKSYLYLKGFVVSCALSATCAKRRPGVHFMLTTEKWERHLHAFDGNTRHQNVLMVRLHVQLRLPTVHQLQVIDDHQSTFWQRWSVLCAVSLHQWQCYDGAGQWGACCWLLRRCLWTTLCDMSTTYTKVNLYWPLLPSILLNCSISCCWVLKGEYL